MGSTGIETRHVSFNDYLAAEQQAQLDACLGQLYPTQHVRPTPVVELDPSEWREVEP